MSTSIASTTPPTTGRSGTWSLSWSGLRTVIVLELRQRVRSTRWTAVLVGWAVVIGILTLLVRMSVRRAYLISVDDLSGGGITAADQARASAEAGRTMFAIIVFLVLSLGALIAPALSATSVNGDRAHGVLAMLQTTLLSPAELAIGKLIAAWLTALALLATATPFIVWAYVEGGTPFGRLVVTVLLLAITLLVVCAVGLGWSAVTARTSSSSVLTYLTVTFLGLGFPLLFAVSLPLVQIDTTVTQNQAINVDDRGRVTECRQETYRTLESQTDRVWWLLAPSPYVVVADAAPRPTASEIGNYGEDPLTAIRSFVREARLGPQEQGGCVVGEPEPYLAQQRQRAEDRETVGLTWPFGLAADLAIGAAFTVLAVRRLRTPTRRLPHGTRVA